MRFVFLLFLCQSVLLAQGTWYQGKGTAVGTDIEAIQLKALNNARADAMSKAGITVSAGDTRLVSESGNELTDFYSKFAESSTKGIILEERILPGGELHRVKGTTSYQLEIEIDARVVLQEGESDPAFSVSLKSSRQNVKEGEPFTLTVTSTKGGYLTIFDVFRDSLSVIFPNAVDRKNLIQAEKPFAFPPHSAYELTLALPAGKSSSSEMFIAVVTKDEIPFPNLADLKFDGGAIQLRMGQLGMFSRWLYGIPIQKRSADQIPMMVQ